jgi:hypothetical protein
MPISKPVRYGFVILGFMLALGACKEKTYIYGVDEVLVQPVDLSGKKEKTPEQYIAILYANLYQRAMSPNQLVQATETITSIGDKQVAYETLISKFMNDPNIKLPSTEGMRDDPESFVIETYKRFFVRVPTEGEKTWMINYIKSHPEVTPEHVYYAFAISNEYYYY